MKRLYIVLVIIAGIIATCVYSLYRIHMVRDQVETYANAVFTAMESGDNLDRQVRELTEYWHRESPVLVRFVHHNQIDEITKSIAKLEPLAYYREYTDLTVELYAITWQMNHIWNSERLSFGSLL